MHFSTGFSMYHDHPSFCDRNIGDFAVSNPISETFFSEVESALEKFILISIIFIFCTIKINDSNFCVGLLLYHSGNPF